LITLSSPPAATSVFFLVVFFNGRPLIPLFFPSFCDRTRPRSLNPKRWRPSAYRDACRALPQASTIMPLFFFFLTTKMFSRGDFVMVSLFFRLPGFFFLRVIRTFAYGPFLFPSCCPWSEFVHRRPPLFSSCRGPSPPSFDFWKNAQRFFSYWDGSVLLSPVLQLRSPWQRDFLSFFGLLCCYAFIVSPPSQVPRCRTLPLLLCSSAFAFFLYNLNFTPLPVLRNSFSPPFLCCG